MDAGTSQDVAKGPPVHTPSVRPREAGSGQVGNTSGLLEAMWLHLLPDHRLTHPGIGWDLAFDPSHSEPSSSPRSVLVFCNGRSQWAGEDIGLGMEA